MFTLKFVFLTYHSNLEFQTVDDWFDHLRASTGILEALARQHTVISIEQINHTGRLVRNGVEYHFLNFGKSVLHFPVTLHNFVKGLAPDIVFVHGMHFPLQVLQLRAILDAHARIIVQNHAERPGSGRKKWLQRLADRSVDAYLFVSHQQGRPWIRRGIISNPARIREVMEASSLFLPGDRSLAKCRTGSDGAPLFLWVGRLDRNKDPLTVLKAFLTYAETHPQARLYMIYQTDGLLSAIKILLAHSLMGSSVVLVGEQPHGQLEHWYNAADFILSGSHYEGSGIAVCEAMSCGCIPVVTDICSFRKMTADGQCGILYPPGDEQALLAALLTTDTLDKDDMRCRVLQQFRSTLSFEAIAGGIQRVASSFANTSSMPPH